MSGVFRTPWLPQLYTRRVFAGGSPRKVVADVGLFTVTGQAVGLERGYPLTAAYGAYSFTGQDAITRKGYPLVAAVGSFAVTGQAAGLKRGYPLTAAVGSFAVTGQAATLRKGYPLTASYGAYNFTGYESITSTYTLVAGGGSFALTGQDATLGRSRNLTVDYGAFALTGQDALSSRGYGFEAGRGRYFTVGFDVQFIIDRPFTEPGGIVIGLGSKAWGYCAVCGFRYPKKKLFKPVVNGRTQVMLRCRSCTDVDNPQGFPQRFIRGRKE